MYINIYMIAFVKYVYIYVYIYVRRMIVAICIFLI